MLFKLSQRDRSERGFDWPEGYIVVTIFTMLMEDIRRVGTLNIKLLRYFIVVENLLPCYIYA